MFIFFVMEFENSFSRLARWCGEGDGYEVEKFVNSEGISLTFTEQRFVQRGAYAKQK